MRVHAWTKCMHVWLPGLKCIVHFLMYLSCIYCWIFWMCCWREKILGPREKMQKTLRNRYGCLYLICKKYIYAEQLTPFHFIYWANKAHLSTQGVQVLTLCDSLLRLTDRTGTKESRETSRNCQHLERFEETGRKEILVLFDFLGKMWIKNS